MLRRDFVQRAPAAAGLVLGAASLPLTGCAGAPYLAPRVSPEGLLVRAADVGPDGVFLQAPSMERPVWVGRDASGEPVALLAACTHQGCQPEPVGDRLVCPCHGSEFDRTGAVLEGPAERPLVRYEVGRRDDDLIVRVPAQGAP